MLIRVCHSTQLAIYSANEMLHRKIAFQNHRLIFVLLEKSHIRIYLKAYMINPQ